MSLDRLIYKVKRTSALADAGSQYGPDAFAPDSSFFAASALRNIAVYDNKPHRLLSNIICRLNTRRCNKPEISLAVFMEAICKILCLTTFRNIAQRNIFAICRAIVVANNTGKIFSKNGYNRFTKRLLVMPGCIV